MIHFNKITVDISNAAFKAHIYRHEYFETPIDLKCFYRLMDLLV